MLLVPLDRPGTAARLLREHLSPQGFGVLVRMLDRLRAGKQVQDAEDPTGGVPV